MYLMNWVITNVVMLHIVNYACSKVSLKKRGSDTCAMELCELIQ